MTQTSSGGVLILMSSAPTSATTPVAETGKPHAALSSRLALAASCLVFRTHGCHCPLTISVSPPTQTLAPGRCLAFSVNTPSWTNNQMVDVGTVIPDGDRVQEPPAWVLPAKPFHANRDLLFTVRADPSRPLIAANSKHPREKGTHRSGLLQCQRLFPGRRPGLSRCEVLPIQSGIYPARRATTDHS